MNMCDISTCDSYKDDTNNTLDNSKSQNNTQQQQESQIPNQPPQSTQIQLNSGFEDKPLGNKSNMSSPLAPSSPADSIQQQ